MVDDLKHRYYLMDSVVKKIILTFSFLSYTMVFFQFLKIEAKLT